MDGAPEWLGRAVQRVDLVSAAAMSAARASGRRWSKPARRWRSTAARRRSASLPSASSVTGIEAGCEGTPRVRGSPRRRRPWRALRRPAPGRDARAERGRRSRPPTAGTRGRTRWVSSPPAAPGVERRMLKEPLASTLAGAPSTLERFVPELPDDAAAWLRRRVPVINAASALARGNLRFRRAAPKLASAAVDAVSFHGPRLVDDARAASTANPPGACHRDAAIGDCYELLERERRPSRTIMPGITEVAGRSEGRHWSHEYIAGP